MNTTGGPVMSFDTTGIAVMIAALNKIDKSPQKAVNKATSKANLIVKRAVRLAAPKKTGTLQKNIVTKSERNHGIKGKKVRQVTFKGGSEANSQLQKPIKHPGALGGKNQKAYYPASMEYGFLARASGGGLVYYTKGTFQTRNAANRKAGWTARDYGTTQATETKYVEGKHFMRDAAKQVEPQVKQTMTELMEKELDKLWQEANHS